MVRAMVRYRHIKWPSNEYEERVYPSYEVAKAAYDEIKQHTYYDDVALYECIELEAKR